MIGRTLVAMSIAASVSAIVMFAGRPAAAAQEERAPILAMKTFIHCINQKIGQGRQANVSNTVQCLPKACTMTLTMSMESAQEACSLGGDDGLTRRCQLPRVILNCPGPPAFTPSYTLCPESGDQNRVELGVEVSRREHIRMVMGDLDLPPGPFSPFDPWKDVISVVDDSKGCNACHDSGNPNAKNGAQQSRAIDTFGRFGGTELGPLVIDTNEPGRVIRPGPGVQAQTLSEVCACIDEAVNDDLHPLAANFVVQALCRELLAYKTMRGWQ